MNGLNRTQYDELISILVLMDIICNKTHLMELNHHYQTIDGRKEDGDWSPLK